MQRQTFSPSRHATLLRTAAACLATLALAACSAGDSTSPGGAALRVINASNAALSVAVDGSTRLASLTPAAISTPINIAPGARRLELRTASGDVAASLDVQAGTGVALVEVHRSSASSDLSASVVPDTGAIPAAGKSKLRVLHLATSMPDVDIWRIQPDYADPVRFMFPFPLGASSSYIQSTAGHWTVIVTTPVSTWDPATANDVMAHAITQLAIDVPADHAYTVAFMDDGSGGVKLVPITD